MTAVAVGPECKEPQLEARHLEIVQAILAEFCLEFAFGLLDRERRVAIFVASLTLISLWSER